MNGERGIVWQNSALDDQDQVLIRLDSTQGVVKIRRDNVRKLEGRTSSAASTKRPETIRVDTFSRSPSEGVPGSNYSSAPHSSYAVDSGSALNRLNQYSTLPGQPAASISPSARSTRRGTVMGDEMIRAQPSPEVTAAAAVRR